MAESAAQRGDYLVNTIMACGNCHSPRDANGQMIKEKAFSGGLTFNTPGASTGQEISRAITHGVARDGRMLKPTMAFAYYAGRKETDLADIIARLRTVPPLQRCHPESAGSTAGPEAVFFSSVIPGRCKHRTRNLEIPGLVLRTTPE